MLAIQDLSDCMQAELLVCAATRAVGSSPGVGRLIDQRGDGAEGSEIEARSADHSVRSAEKKFFAFISSYQLSGWALVAPS